MEGLRGWLAVLVVLGHFFAFVGLKDGALWRTIGSIPSLSVSVFILISGFVIANLALSTREKYGLYIFRRFLRLFPVYIICCALGAMTNETMYSIISGGSMNGILGAEFIRETSATVESVHKNFWAHSVAHLALMQGLVPDAILSFSSRAFMPPGWSLSLEWQFYLIAPFWIGLLHDRRLFLAGTLLCLLMLLAYRFYLAEFYRLPSLLPGKAGLFYAGIVSRLYLEKNNNYLHVSTFSRQWQLVVLVVSIVCLALFPQFLLGIIWFIFILILTGGFGGHAAAAHVKTLFNMVFLSKTAQWLGARSYSIYACHWPGLELSAIAADAFPALALSRVTMFVSAMLTVLLLTEIIHRLVERPYLQKSRGLGRKA